MAVSGRPTHVEACHLTSRSFRSLYLLSFTVYWPIITSHCCCRLHLRLLLLPPSCLRPVIPLKHNTRGRLTTSEMRKSLGGMGIDTSAAEARIRERSQSRGRKRSRCSGDWGTPLAAGVWWGGCKPVQQCPAHHKGLPRSRTSMCPILAAAVYCMVPGAVGHSGTFETPFLPLPAHSPIHTMPAVARPLLQPLAGLRRLLMAVVTWRWVRARALPPRSASTAASRAA